MEKLTKKLPASHAIVEQPHKIPFKKGDKVTTFDDKGLPVRGTVAWIGKHIDVRPDGSCIIGIYVVRFV